MEGEGLRGRCRECPRVGERAGPEEERSTEAKDEAMVISIVYAVFRRTEELGGVFVHIDVFGVVTEGCAVAGGALRGPCREAKR
jgi:hypothetical protein